MHADVHLCCCRGCGRTANQLERFTLPNPQITPAWRTYASSACQASPEACAGDNRFWEQWDFKNFQSAIDSTFATVESMGQYQGIMMILPLGDTPQLLEQYSRDV